MLKTSQFPEPGLYLLFPDGQRIDLTLRHIEEVTAAYLSDSTLIPASVKAAAAYQLCDICPERHRAKICHAIMPALPFVQRFNSYMSYDLVTAVYREDEQPILQVAETSMQRALQFISILSMTRYCEIGRCYAHNFNGVNPLMPITRIAELVFSNMYVHHQGNLSAIHKEITHMQEQTLTIAGCQINRLRLISKSDALANAFANTQTITHVIFFQVKDHIAAREKAGNPG